MAKQVVLKSLSTGLTGLYPESHLGLDPDLVLDSEDVDCGCWPEGEAEGGNVEDNLEPEEIESPLTDDEDKENTDGE